MKSLKSFLALILSTIMVFTMATTALAAEPDTDSIPEYATKHDITITVDPGEYVADTDGAIMPLIWGERDTGTLPYATTQYTVNFYVSDRYFAFEANGTGSGSGLYGVSLMYGTSSPIAGFSDYINSGNHKVDWITLSSSGNYCFRIINSTTSSINVHITYYSWQ